MASDVNNTTRKRKATSELIFEVDEADFSPTNSPEPIEQNICVSINELEFSKTSNDTCKRSEDCFLKSEDIIVRTKEMETSIKSIIKLHTLDTSTELNVKTLNSNSLNTFDGISEILLDGTSIDKTDNESLESQITKSDVDLRCMDMDVDNSPPPPQIIDKPFISLVFRDKDTACSIRSKLMQYIRNIAEFDLKLKLSSFSTEVAIDFWEENVDTANDFNESLNFKADVNQPESEKLDLFIVDTTPSKKPQLLPRYTPNNCNIIGESEANINEHIDNRRILVCFNCDGNHSMKDCKKMRNVQRITQARNKFIKSQQKSVRYHVDDEHKYKHLEPGKISDELRRALDVRKHELPPYIYRMRILGYPPGWLQEAMIMNSNLELFDFQGCAVDDCNEANNKIDSNKIVEYPGFNIPLEKGYKDEYKYFNCPPYNESYSKKCMIEYIEKNSDEVIIKKDNFISEQKNEESDNNSQESDLKCKVRRSESPTLLDLELRKKQLLAELEEGSINSPQSSICETNETENKLSSSLSKSVTESPVVVSSLFGTPVLKNTSSYVQLPDRDKFSKDISQVINFENLPDSTGKYEQINVVLNKVRNTIKNNKS